MTEFFLKVYSLFKDRRVLLHASMLLLFVLFASLAMRMDYEEDIMRFIPSTSDNGEMKNVFQNLKVKDKILVFIGGSDYDASVSTADTVAARLQNLIQCGLAQSVKSDVMSGEADAYVDYVRHNFVSYLDDSDYSNFDSLLTEEGMDEKLKGSYLNLMMPSGFFTKRFLVDDPLCLTSSHLDLLGHLNWEGGFEVADNHLISEDGRVVIIVNPAYPASNTSKNSVLVDSLESVLNVCLEIFPAADIEYFGAPAISVYNSRQIQKDIYTTMGVAMLVVLTFIVVAFRNKYALILIFVPVLFGALFALAVLSLFKGSLSIIAVGAGSTVLGVVLSYSIHVVAHSLHVRNVETLIREMAKPLTIGSFTTIGAFFSLVLTSSQVLQDFGWFSSLSIIGTTFFCLIYLPHFLRFNDTNGSKESFVLKCVERLCDFRFEKHVWLVWVILAIAGVGAILSPKVGFDSDMNNLGYIPPKFASLDSLMSKPDDSGKKGVFVVAVGGNKDSMVTIYRDLQCLLDSLKNVGAVGQVSSAAGLLRTNDEQKKSVDRWNKYWTKSKVDSLKLLYSTLAPKYGFSRELRFPEFFADSSNCGTASSALSDFVSENNGSYMAVAHISVDDSLKASVYENISTMPSVVILDKPHFLSKFMSIVSDDFNFVLFVSSFIVFAALLLSYRRLDMALVTFMPMALSWFVILGVMAVLDLKFNIVSVIISTFIFGTGDDFSIFVTDGLISDRKGGSNLLVYHKMAIMFSAFTTVVGMGALLFAKHPSLLSVAQSSVIGMVSVLLFAYIIQPYFFKVLIADRENKGKRPLSLRYLFESFCGIFRK